MRSRTGWFCSLVVVGTLLTAGCDDVILYDISATGQLLVAADAQGKSGLVGNKKRKRHLFWVDPETGTVDRLTTKARRLAWPRAVKTKALYVESRKRLVLDSGVRRRTIYASKKALLQPLVSPSADHVAVLEAKQLGVTGTLLVIEIKTGKVVHKIDRALLGGTWSEEGLLVPRSKEDRTDAFSTAPGEIVRVDPKTFRARPLFRTKSFPAMTVLAQVTPKDLVGVLHVSGAKKALGLARLSLVRRGATRGKVGFFDFWPTPSADGDRILFTRSAGDKPSVQAELRLTSLDRLNRSSLVPTPGKVAAPRWVGDDRIAFLTSDDRLIIQDLDGENRIDLTAKLRAAFARGAQEKTK